MSENEIAKLVISSAYDLHREVGPGLLESVYEAILADMLRARGVEVVRQQAIPVRFRGRRSMKGSGRI